MGTVSGQALVFPFPPPESGVSLAGKAVNLCKETVVRIGLLN